MQWQSERRRGSPAVRQELPVRRLPSLVLRGLTATGDPADDEAAVRDLTFSLDAGSLTLAGPPVYMRTVFSVLADTARAEALDLEGSTIGQCRLITDRLPSSTRLQDVLHGVGPAAERAAHLVGLTPHLESDTDELDSAQRSLASLAVRLAEAPDVAMLDDPLCGLDPDRCMAFPARRPRSRRQ